MFVFEAAGELKENEIDEMKGGEKLQKICSTGEMS